MTAAFLHPERVRVAFSQGGSAGAQSLAELRVTLETRPGLGQGIGRSACGQGQALGGHMVASGALDQGVHMEAAGGAGLIEGGQGDAVQAAQGIASRLSVRDPPSGTFGEHGRVRTRKSLPRVAPNQGGEGVGAGELEQSLLLGATVGEGSDHPRSALAMGPAAG